MTARIVNCWEEGPPCPCDDMNCITGSTCMLLDGHDGPHEFTPDDEITIGFNP